MPGIEQGEHTVGKKQLVQPPWTPYYVTHFLKETSHTTACFAFHNNDMLWELGACPFLDILTYTYAE